jgi:hypothetical protein
MEYWIVYRDVTGFPRKQFEKIDAPKAGDKVIKDMVMPGMFDYPSMYIRSRRVPFIGGDVVNLITYTEKELSREEVMSRFDDFLAILPPEAQEIIGRDPGINMLRAFTTSMEYISQAAVFSMQGKTIEAQQAQAMSDLYYSIGMAFKKMEEER